MRRITHIDVGFVFGTVHETVDTLIDWHQHEHAMNALPHLITTLDAVGTHFIHEQGSGPNPAPLLIAHGWPYSFHPYNGIIDQLSHPERHGGRMEDAFSVVVPSYPGYDFSSRPRQPMDPLAIALLLTS